MHRHKWELLKNVGFDKPLYKLPALVVDDWSVVTPDLLRSAYVEVIGSG